MLGIFEIHILTWLLLCHCLLQRRKQEFANAVELRMDGKTQYSAILDGCSTVSYNSVVGCARIENPWVKGTLESRILYGCSTVSYKRDWMG